MTWSLAKSCTRRMIAMPRKPSALVVAYGVILVLAIFGNQLAWVINHAEVIAHWIIRIIVALAIFGIIVRISFREFRRNNPHLFEHRGD